MNRVLVVFSDGLLSELDSARGLVSRSAWIRQAVEDKLMKEAVAPLVPEGLVGPTHWSKGRLTDEDWASFQGGAGFETPAPKPKARRKKATVGDLESDEPIDLMVALKASVDAMKAATTQGPARCNRGACTGTINPVSGRCLHCMQKPLKESK